ncbi:MAG TPA: acetyl-CoA carboxylase biotin carboxylase subunit [Bacillota bacterium]|nr:acetyl-CoA carboxylase biotin carboxylase subunit [Bacillota bacterium]HPZ21500.1 acetyl-CoA carboxylase biotin carboxylase subunit [Bacillota bacterium]HQD19360.1 acetyl-CoA carboxylase biotin carboxylase subunit [Bacillota bacterium]
MMTRVLIANRGEIALRVIRACRELGMETIAVYAQGDEDTPHVALADEQYCIGPAPAGLSYLNVQNILTVALEAKADAIHPGYGFLAENPGFAKLCHSLGLVFIGPSPEAIEAMGNKTRARELMEAAGVPVVPGTGPLTDGAEAEAMAAEIGYPIMLKAAAGGGGKGMRLVEEQESLSRALEIARSEGEAAFGDARVYMEKYIQCPRHVEIQVLADNHGNVVHLGERDCSVQRRHQKLLEEAPCPVLTPDLRARMGEAAVRAAKAVNYSGVGTVEFLLDKEGKFYFMEMNTRIQVEHPVTEMITGIDLVKAQLQAAAGEQLAITQEDIEFRGWAIECRINAEDPQRGFRPAPGLIQEWQGPGGPWVRVDGVARSGWQVPPHYDSMIAKIIVWGQDREEAIARMKRALLETRVEGIPTTIPLHLEILASKDFISGNYSTALLGRLLEKGR